MSEIIPAGFRLHIRRSSLLLVPLFLLIFILQCAWFIRTQSLTNDEPEHIVAGLEAWRYGEFQHWSGHPPLGRMLFALPLLNTNWKYHLADNQVRLDAPASEIWSTGPRIPAVLLGVAQLMLLWIAARYLFSEGTANFVLGLAAFSPELVAHFSLATTDGIGCLFLFACILQWLYYWHKPTWWNAVAFGILAGLLSLAKYNSPPMLVVLLSLMLFLTPGKFKLNWTGLPWRRIGLIVLIACFVTWAGFLFHVSKVAFANQSVSISFAGYTKQLQYDIPTLKTPITLYWPACEWFTGFGWRMAEDMGGHRSFLLGHYTMGSKLYFPVAMVLKWPPMILLLGAVGVCIVLLRRLRNSSDLLMISICPALYLLLAIMAPINIGVRHVLPVYPFLLLYAGAAGAWIAQRKWGQILLTLLILAQAADTMRYAPNDLAYFTPFVSPNRTWTLLSDSNTDWGQGLYALRDYQVAHPQEAIHLAYVGEVDPAWMGIKYERLGELDRPTGTVVVSAAHLSGQLLSNHEAYRWLLQYPLKAVLDHTLYVFEVPERK